MSKLPQRKQEAVLVISSKDVAVDLYSGKVKAIELKRKMVALPEVIDSLGKVEQKIFVASAKKLISEHTDSELVKVFSEMFRFLSMDIGYIRPQDATEWSYICTRLVSILGTYYGNLSVADVKLAFELLVVGELNDFLPVDSKGQPDKNHYQNFNAEYLSKILNAYQKKQSQVVFKAFKSLPEPGKNTTEEQKEFYRRQTYYDLAYCYLHFKYLRRLPESVNDISEALFYDKLVEMGFVDDIQITDEEKADALRYFLTTSRGNKYENMSIYKKGADHEKVKGRARVMARKKLLKETFLQMALDEVQVIELLNPIK